MHSLASIVVAPLCNSLSLSPCHCLSLTFFLSLCSSRDKAIDKVYAEHSLEYEKKDGESLTEHDEELGDSLRRDPNDPLEQVEEEKDDPAESIPDVQLFEDVHLPPPSSCQLITDLDQVCCVSSVCQ